MKRFLICLYIIFSCFMLTAQCPKIYQDRIKIESARTNVPEWILFGIIYAESSNAKRLYGDDGHSLGAWMLLDKYRIERENKWGMYNPFDPILSTRIAANILAENYSILKDWTLTIASYSQGVTGVLKNGINIAYVRKVVLYRENRSYGRFRY